jgi:hypothetical protein
MPRCLLIPRSLTLVRGRCETADLDRGSQSFMPPISGCLSSPALDQREGMPLPLTWERVQVADDLHPLVLDLSGGQGVQVPFEGWQ